ncbi:hypothetical protein [Serratia marcescens]|uniref:hypothetical protein n=1 Tax=Serratia marcescens TaxID=615 RepID=UPI001F14D90D|nr:hypothetical protein [Serratia marcescens]
MSNDKQKKIAKMLKRHEEFYDQKSAVSLINDFLQLSKLLEELRESKNTKVFNAMYALIEKSLNDDIIISERGNRISKLQKGQVQPKGTGHKNLHGLNK